MPVYEYKCPKCGKVSECRSTPQQVWQLHCFCVDCKVEMKRIFTPVGVVWKCSRPTAYSKEDVDKKMSDVPDD